MEFKYVMIMDYSDSVDHFCGDSAIPYWLTHW